MARVYPKMPQILYDNLFHDQSLTLSVTSFQVGFPKENLYNWQTFSRYKKLGTTSPSFIRITGLPAVDVNCYAIYGHNLFTAGALDVGLYRNGSGTPIAGTSLQPLSDDPILIFFDKQTGCNRLDIIVNATGGTFAQSPEFGVVFAGLSLEVPNCPSDGFNPQDYEKVTLSKRTRKGFLIGQDHLINQRRYNGNIPWLPYDWVDNYLYDFFINHVPNPFIFAWNNELQPDNHSIVVWNPERFNVPWDKIYRGWAFSFLGVEGGDL